MSEEGSFGLSFVERVFGLVILIAGAMISYYTFTSTAALGAYTGFFGFLSLAVSVLGLILITAKTEE